MQNDRVRAYVMLHLKNECEDANLKEMRLGSPISCALHNIIPRQGLGKVLTVEMIEKGSKVMPAVLNWTKERFIKHSWSPCIIVNNIGMVRVSAVGR
jgi:hypothetical protein